jgi:excisionase family DNA binding protein
MHPMAERKSPKPKKPTTARWQRIAMMDKEILDVEGAATLLGVSTTTIYNLARKGEIPATRVGREWRLPGRILFNGSLMAAQLINSAWR